MILTVEDTLSEAVLQKLIAVTRPDLHIDVTIGNRGKSYIRSRAQELNRTARSLQVFILIDLDSWDQCPAEIIPAWLNSAPSPNLLFRIAIMEIESWLLADRTGISNFLGIPTHRIPNNTDYIERPKEFLIDLSRKSRRKNIRLDLIPPHGSTSKVGPAYNSRLSEFANSSWNPTVAAMFSPSLRRTIERLSEAFI